MMLGNESVRVCGSDRFADLGELRALEGNPRTLTQEAAARLDESLVSLGLFRPLLVWKNPEVEGLSVIGGNQRFHRLRALIEQGSTLVLDDGSPAPGVPVTVFEGSEERARLVALRDNNSDGEWDWSALAEFTSDLSERLAALGESTIDLSLAGFDPIVLEDLSVYSTASNPGEPPEFYGDSEPPVPPPEEGLSEDERRLSDPSMHEVKVAIGHVRGKLSAATYERLVSALAIEGDASNGAGLDAAFSALLDRVV